MKKLVVAAVAGIALLGAIAVAVIVIATGSGGFTTGSPGLGSVPSAPPPGGPLPPLPPLPGASQQPEPPPIMSPPRPKPPEGSWEAVTPVARPAAAGPVGAAVGRELNELQPRLAACFDEEAQARHGQAGHTVVKDYAPIEDTGTTILMLEVEAGRGEARIVDAPVETQGRASDGLIACAQRVLRGHVVRTSAATGQGRYRILFPLLP